MSEAAVEATTEATTEETTSKDIPIDKAVDALYKDSTESSTEETKEETKEETTEETSEDPPKKPEAEEDKPTDKNEGELNLKLSDDSVLQQEDLEGISMFAKEHGLTADQAQAMLEREESIVKGMESLQQEELKKQSEKWIDQAKKDDDIGGNAFNQSIEDAYQALEAFGSQELNELLDSTQLGNHPEMIKVFSKMGKMIQDDKFVKPGAEAGKNLTRAQIMYGEN